MPRRTAAPNRANGIPRTNGTKPRRRDAEVLAAAADVFYERGYASATVQDVADSLGMLKGSLYYYIDSKEDLLYLLMEEIHEGVGEMLATIQAEEDLSALQQLERYARATIEYNARNLKKISVYYHDIDLLGGARREEIVSWRRSHEDQITDLIRQAQAEGDAVEDIDPKLLTNCLFATVIWMYRWYRPGRGVSVDDISETCGRFVLGGLTGQP